MIKEIIIRCDDEGNEQIKAHNELRCDDEGNEQIKAHNEWLKEQTEIIDMLDKYIDDLRSGKLRMDLIRVRDFIKRGEM